MNKPPTSRARFGAHLAVFTGVAVLLWSGFEDSDAAVVTILGALAAAAAALALFDSPRVQAMANWDAMKRAVLFGALVGALSSVTTPALMLFKNLRHAHIFPDFPAGMMLATVERMPRWALAGALAGCGLGLLLKLALDVHLDRHGH